MALILPKIIDNNKLKIDWFCKNKIAAFQRSGLNFSLKVIANICTTLLSY